MFLLDLDRNALMNALPRTPTPGDSNRPRAKTTSTAGQAADADGTTPGAGNVAGAISPAVATTTATATNAHRRVQRRESRSIPTPAILTECCERNRQFIGGARPGPRQSRRPGWSD